MTTATSTSEGAPAATHEQEQGREVFDTLLSDFETHYFPWAVLRQRAPSRREEGDAWQKYEGFAERFRDYFASYSRDITFTVILLACVLLGVILAVLAAIQDLRSLLIIAGGLVAGLAITLPFWANEYRRIIPTRRALLAPFIAFALLALVVLGFPLSLLVLCCASVFLLMLTVVYANRRPISLKGQLCYSLLILQTTALRATGQQARALPDAFANALESLNQALSHTFDLVVDNRGEIEACFNRRLLFDGQDYRRQFNLFDDPKLREFFAARTSDLPVAGDWAKADWKPAQKPGLRASRDESAADYDDMHAHLGLVCDKLQPLTAEFQFQRVRLRDRMRNRIDKVIAVVALLASVVLGVLEFLDYTNLSPFR
jgi:hypothetical protein